MRTVARIVVIGVLVVSAASFAADRLWRTSHGPDDGPLEGAAYALADILYDDPTGTIGGLPVNNPTAHAAEIEAVYVLGIDADRLTMSNLRLSPRRAPNDDDTAYIYRAGIEADRPEDRLGWPPTVPAGSRSELTFLVDFEFTGTDPVEIFGYRVEYRHQGRRYAAYWPIYQCLFVNREHECPEDLPLIVVEDIHDLAATEIPPISAP